jgi:hypothetical protein
MRRDVVTAALTIRTEVDRFVCGECTRWTHMMWAGERHSDKARRPCSLRHLAIQLTAERTNSGVGRFPASRYSVGIGMQATMQSQRMKIRSCLTCPFEASATMWRRLYTAPQDSTRYFPKQLVYQLHLLSTDLGANILTILVIPLPNGRVTYLPLRPNSFDTLPNPEGKTSGNATCRSLYPKIANVIERRPKPKWSITSERCSRWLYSCMQRKRARGRCACQGESAIGEGHGHYRRLVRRSSESANMGVVGMIDGVVGKFADSGGVHASKHSESGGVCFGPVSSCN